MSQQQIKWHVQTDFCSAETNLIWQHKRPNWSWFNASAFRCKWRPHSLSLWFHKRQNASVSPQRCKSQHVFILLLFYCFFIAASSFFFISLKAAFYVPDSFTADNEMNAWTSVCIYVFCSVNPAFQSPAGSGSRLHLKYLHSIIALTESRIWK